MGEGRERSVAHGHAACGNASGQTSKSETVLAAIAAGGRARNVVTLVCIRGGDVVKKNWAGRPASVLATVAPEICCRLGGEMAVRDHRA